MKLLIQPDDGVAPLLSAIESATKSIDIVIFRFDRKEVEAALKAAAGRGVFVHALIAYTNRGGEKHLRQLEANFLEAGISVARTSDDLARYHGKMMIIDASTLYVLSFNFTHMDIDHSRGFGLVTEDRELVQEAAKLFEADSTRQPYTPGLSTFVVSPENSRKELAAFLKAAEKQLLIYDPKTADREMLRILEDRSKAGVEIRMIGRLGKGAKNLAALKLARFRLHTRTFIRDGRDAFVGSQSLRRAELDSRREVGLIADDADVVRRLTETFEADWAAIEQAKLDQETSEDEAAKATKIVRKAVKALVNDLPPLAPIVREVVREVVESSGTAPLNHKEVQETVKEAVKEAVQREEVREAIKEAIKEVVQEPK